MSLHSVRLELSRLNRAYIPPKLAPWARSGTRLHGSTGVEHINSAAIRGSGKLPARSIKGERANHQPCGYSFAHIPPCQAAVGAGKHPCIRGSKDMLWIGWIDRHIAVDQVRDSVLVPARSHIGGLIDARIAR